MSKLLVAGLRALRRLRYSLSGSQTRLVYHPDYELPVAGVPLDPLRGQRILAYLLDQGVIGQQDARTPIPASLKNIAKVHTADYLDQLDRPETMEAVLGFRTEDETWQQFIDLQRLAAGGTVHATRLALRTGCVAVNLGGGFHHARPDRGMGFCIINDIAVAVARLRSRGYSESILIVDLDIHDGNGTRTAFANDPTVYTFSIHNETWDHQEAVADSCIELGEGVGDAEYLRVLESELPRVIADHEPALVVYVAGVDPVAGDKMGNWRVSREGLLRRDQFVIEHARRGNEDMPIAVVLGGGYGKDAWRYTAGFVHWLFTGNEHVPTEDVEAIVRRFRRIEHDAKRKEAKARASAPDWELDESDLMMPGIGVQSDARVLGVFTKHRIELLLERLGILNQIRAKGFVSPTIVLDAHSTLGHTIRLFGDTQQAELLVELRVRRDRASVPGMEALYVEWLLLQNPRAEFGDRPRLPGQEFPGLGLLREIVALLVVVCEQIGLDGIVFVPAHYYMAALGRRHLRFVRNDDAIVFEAIRRAVAGLDLGTATNAMEAGRVIDRRTGDAISWHTPPMIMPISERLSGQLGSAGAEALPVEAGVALDYELMPQP
ncbi:MAG: histone deacetylase [Gemmatimonadota bacterium]|nr:MAG: histone deacetylase [Gemmatimonadota bacterium]